MRLGAQPAGWSRPAAGRPQCYGTDEISERHRHRYEFNNDYRQQFEAGACRSSAPAPTARWWR